MIEPHHALHTPDRAIPLAARLLRAAALNRAADMLALAGLRRRLASDAHTLGVALALQRIGSIRNQALATWLRKETRVTDAPADFLVVAARAATICTDLGIPYLIGGGVASTVHGEFRTTRDIDLVISLPKRADVQRLALALEAEFALHVPDVADAYRQTSDAAQDRAQRGSFSAYDRVTGYRLDVHVSGNTPFDMSQFDRSIPITIPEIGAMLMIASVEDTILTKLEWYAITPSDRQWDDVQTIVRVQDAALDLSYLDHWAIRLGVDELWKQAQTSQIPPHHHPGTPAHAATDAQQMKLDLGE